MNFSVLARARPELVRPEPFPHLMIEEALPRELYDKLSASYPPIRLFAQDKAYRSNRVMFYRAAQILQGGDVSKLWYDFTAYHTSAAFRDEVLRVLGRYVYAMYPTVEWGLLPTGVRGIDDADFCMDAQFGINTPVVGTPTSVRGPHLDNGDKLFNGLLYFRHPDDISDGGDFLLYRKKRDQWARVARVPYRENTLVFFVNCPAAVHAVSPRTEGPYPRRYMNFAGEYRAALFKADKVA